VSGFIQDGNNESFYFRGIFVLGSNQPKCLWRRRLDSPTIPTGNSDISCRDTRFTFAHSKTTSDNVGPLAQAICTQRRTQHLSINRVRLIAVSAR
jgi:hypothetical protein